MINRGSALAGAGLGATVMYFLDPSSGARRRARIRDMTVHTATVSKRGIGKTGRDARHRAYGTAAWVRSLVRRRELDDRLLAERARAKLGRLVSHPHAIDVVVSHGSVTLEGPILEREAARLTRAVGRLRGVTEVVDRMERHHQPGNVPALQGGRARTGVRPDVLQANWAPTTRVVAAAAGAALVASGTRRSGAARSSMVLVGAGLFARAAANVPICQMLGVASRRAVVDVQKTITINAPVGEVYAFWSLYENFPRFISRVLEVKSGDADPMRSHWTVAGPAGAPVEFDAEVVKAIPNQLISWHTLGGARVAHCGIVRFDPEQEGRTRVHVRMSYTPPAGSVGHGIAKAFGVDPKHSMDADLARMKTLIETGHAPHDAAYRQRAPAAP